VLRLSLQMTIEWSYIHTPQLHRCFFFLLFYFSSALFQLFCISLLTLIPQSELRPHKWKVTVRKTAPASNACNKDHLQFSLNPSNSLNPSKSRASHFQLNSFWKDTQNSGKHLQLQFYYKGHRSWAATWMKRSIGWGLGRVLNMELVCPLLLESGHVTLPTTHQCVHQPESSAEGQFY